MVIPKGLHLSFACMFIFFNHLEYHFCRSTRLPRERDVEAMFVFGDSMVDGGNDFYIPMEYDNFENLPYGVDFPCGPTGRFTNGRNLADVLSNLSGIPFYLPVFKDPRTRGDRLLNGVNFASGGSGILDSTGFISLIQQVHYFQNQTLADLRSRFTNSSEYTSFFSRSLFVFNTGGNDLAVCFSLNNTDCSASHFLEGIMKTFNAQVEKIYHAGARKFVFFGIQAMGCDPGSRAEFDTGENCSQVLNMAAVTLNNLLLSNMQEFKNKLSGFHYVYVDTYNISSSIIADQASYGFKVANDSCCEVMNMKELPYCKKLGHSCSDRRLYVYWDGTHFTEAAYGIIGRKAFYSQLETEVYPFNIEHLSKLNLECHLKLNTIDRSSDSSF